MSISQSLKNLARELATPLYNYATPYLNAELPFPNNGTLVDSYSFHKEDLIIDAILGCKPTGMYIDIGTNDPIFQNNTKRFSKRGWTGINIEPTRKKFLEILKDRHNDTNLNVAISDKDTTMPFYVLDWDMASTLDKSAADHYCKLHKTFIKQTVVINVRRIDTIFKQYCEDKSVDFMSIDVEEQIMPVLEGNDWDKYRPTLLCIEQWHDLAVQIREFMESKDYLPVFKTEENGFYIDKNKVKK